MNVINGKKAKPLPFSPSQFDYGRNDFASKVPQSLGYAGLRLHAPFKTPKYYDEVIVSSARPTSARSAATRSWALGARDRDRHRALVG